MTDREYRQDDTSDGYCPLCGEPLANLTVAAQGYCERHGWVSADWTPPAVSADYDNSPDEDWGEGDDTP